MTAAKMKRLHLGILLALSLWISCAHYHEPMKNEAAQAFFETAQEFQYKGDLANALVFFNKADSASPDHTAILNNRGNLRSSMGDDAGAVDDLSRAITLCKDPDQLEVYYSNRALVHMQFKRMDKACED